MSIIKKAYKAKQVKEGAGVLVNRVFGYYETPDFDPFLMLDYWNSTSSSPSPGFPWHPHKGIETITYNLRGKEQHEDNFGNKGIIDEGELQWMSAGKGIYHQETPLPSEDGSEGFQFWLNLPRKDKLKDPDYKYIKKGEMRIVKENNEVRVISGTYKDVQGPIDKSNLGVTMLHVLLDENQSIELTRDAGKNGYIFMFKGNASIGDEKIESNTAYTLNEGTFRIQSTEKTEFIYAEGVPLNEPIAWKGPIVMNTQEEIIETFRDLRNGTF